MGVIINCGELGSHKINIFDYPNMLPYAYKTYGANAREEMIHHNPNGT